MNRLAGDEGAARDAWSKGIEHLATRAGARTLRGNLRVQSWLANAEACLGRTDSARAKVERLNEAEPHNGYLKYRSAHVLAELGDTGAAIRALREAVQDGFLSVQLLRHDERLGISSLVNLTEYCQIKQTLQHNVARAKSKYAPRG